MNVSALLLELFGRIPPLADDAVRGLDARQLAEAPGDGANPIGWLVWHLTRVADSHLAEIVADQQVWEADGWAARFALSPDPGNTGYGHSPDQVAAVRPDSADALLAYLAAVDARTRRFLSGVADGDLDRIVDRNWDPPVTLGVRLVSIADDCLQHAGQANYARGLLGY